MADVLDVEQRENRLCELVDGVLVEKAMGFQESLLAMALGGFLRDFVNSRDLGIVSGADGMLQLFPNLVRIPDVAFVSWQRLPNQRISTEPVPEIVPDLVVEILSRGNTVAEMDRKRREYFSAGVRLLGVIDWESRTATVFTQSDRGTVVEQSIDGGDVLPGFRLPLADLFAELDRRGG